MEKELLDITFDKGVNFADPDSTLQDGEAVTLQNWYPFRGGLRARRGWKSATTSVSSGSFPSTRNGRGLGIVGPLLYAAHADSAASVNEVQIATLTGFSGTDSFTVTLTPPGGTSQTTAVITRGGNYDVAGVKAAIEDVAFWAATGVVTISALSDSGFTATFSGAYAGIDMGPMTITDGTGCSGTVAESVKGSGPSYQIWSRPVGDIDSGTWTPVATIPATDSSYPVAFASTGDYVSPMFSLGSANADDRYATIALHKDLIFRATGYGVLDGTDTITVGDGDGHSIVDICSWNDYLAIGKTNSVWLLSGAGIDTYRLDKVDGDASAARGRSLCPWPGGLFIVGQDAVWNLTNSTERISGPLDGTFAVPSGGFVHTAYQRGKLHIVCSDGGTYVYDTEAKSWSTEAAGTVAEGPNAVMSPGNEYLYATTKAATTNSLALYRKLSTVTPARDAGTGEVFAATTPIVFLGDGMAQVVTREVYVRVRQYGTTATQPALNIVAYDESGTTITTKTVAMHTANPTVFVYEVDFGANKKAFQLGFSYTMTTSHSVMCEVERIQAVVQITERR